MKQKYNDRRYYPDQNAKAYSGYSEEAAEDKLTDYISEDLCQIRYVADEIISVGIDRTAEQTEDRIKQRDERIDHIVTFSVAKNICGWTKNAKIKVFS